MERPSKRTKHSTTTTSTPRTSHMTAFIHTVTVQQHASISNSVDFRHCDTYGWHAVAKTRIPAGSPIFTLPLHLCMTHKTAKLHPVLGPILCELRATTSLAAVDFDRACVYSQLLYELHLGTASMFASYIAILPTLAELEARVATCRVDARSKNALYKSKCLQGTHIEQSIVPKHVLLLGHIHKEITEVLQQRLGSGDRAVVWAVEVTVVLLCHHRMHPICQYHSNQRIRSCLRTKN